MSSAAQKKQETDQQIVEKVRRGNEDAFETLFFEYYYELCSVALKVTKSPEGARDVVQDVFLRLWKNRSRWQIQISLKAYLYQAVWNQALNHREKKARLQKTREQF